MTSSVEKLIINELLCFVQCKIHVIDVISLTQICESNFKLLDIEEAAKVLAEAGGIRTSRRGEGRSKRLLQDIIAVFQEKDTTALPTFVAKDLHRLPPVYFDHIDATSLLKDILIIKQDLLRIKTDYVTTASIAELQEKTAELQTAVSNLQPDKEHQERTSLGRSEQLINQDKSKSEKLNNFVQYPQKEGKRKQRHRRSSNSTVAAATSRAPPAGRGKPAWEVNEIKANQLTRSLSSDVTAPCSRSRSNDRSACDRLNSTLINCNNTNIDETIVNQDSDNNSFETVVNKKKQHRKTRKIVNQQGKAALTSNVIKVAPRLSYLFVTRFRVNTTAENIIDFIKESGNQVINVEKIEQFHQSNFSSFKITIEQTQESIFMSEEFWPAGIEYRRYTLKRIYNKTNSNNNNNNEQH